MQDLAWFKNWSRLPNCTQSYEYGLSKCKMCGPLPSPNTPSPNTNTTQNMTTTTTTTTLAYYVLLCGQNLGAHRSKWFVDNTDTHVRAQYVRMPNTYDSYVLGLKFSFLTKKWVAQPNTYEWLWLSKSYKYWSSSLWKFISSLKTTRPMAISSKDNSTHGNFVQGQLDPRQFRPRTTPPTAISSKDNSTNGNFVQIQSWLSLQGLVEGHPPPS